VSDMRHGAHHAGDIADAIDAIARRSAGLLSFVGRYRRLAELPPPMLRPVRVADLVQRMDQLMSITLSEKGIEYVSRIEPPELTVHADSDLLEQVLVNLLLNAIEACSGIEEPRIEVSCHLAEDTVVIRVADSGCGLDPTRIERIFVPLFTTKPGGSGIGLSLARQIAHAHGGKLEAAMNAPRGAVFTLELPTRVRS
jgi:two-component system, NtrC family, nitrogen regulation sensor histidine kinase NtrY